MTQADIPKKKPSEELQALRQRVAELEALEAKRQADNKPLLLKDEPLYKAVFESANDSLFLVDKKGNILDFNNRLTEIGGYEKEELIGKNIRSIAGKVTRKSLVILVTNFLKRMANISISPYEVEMYKKNGELVTVEISARPLRKDGKIIGDLAILRDVTERKRMENEILEKSSELQLINSINDAANRGLSLDEIIKIVSEEIQKLYGGFASITYLLNEDKQSLVARNYKFPSRMVHAIEKLIHMKMSDINFRLKEGSIHSETLKTGKVQVTNDILALQQIPEEYTDDKTLQKLLPLVVKTIGVRSVITVPLISEGKAIGLLDIARHEPSVEYDLERLQTISKQFVNVIKRKQAEEALKISEQNFRNSIDTSLMGIHIVDKEWHTLYANRAFLDIYGYENIAKLKASRQEDRYTPESYAIWVERHEKTLRGEPVPDQIEADIIRKDGTIRHVQSFRKEVIWNGKQQYQLLYNDVTERQQVEEALKESETRYHELANTITSGVFIYQAVDNGEDFVFVDVSSAAEKMEGINRKDIIGRRITEVLPGAKDFFLFKVFQRVWQTGNSEYFASGERQDEKETGRWRDNWAYKLPSGEIVNVYNDITERKRAEEALKASENSFRNSLDNSPLGIRISDRKDETLYANQAYLNIFGYENIEALKASPPLTRYTPEAYAGFLQRMEDHKTGAPRPDSVEIDIVHNDGKIRHLLLSTRELMWYGQQQFQNLYTDITDRKQAEEALKASEQNFRNSIDSSLMGIRIVDEEWHTLYANQVFLDIFGYKNINEVSTSALQDHYTPEEHARYLLRKEKRTHGEEVPTTPKVDIIGKNGDIRHLEIYSNEVFWGGKQRRQITYHDITERQQAEEALKESETRYHELVNTITSGVVIYRAVDNGEDFVFVDINGAAEKMEGVNRKDIIGKRITEVLPGSKDFNLFKVFQKVWRTGNSEYYSSSFQKDGGNHSTWRDNWTYKLPSGEIVNVYNDITDKKLAEEALKASEEKYSTLIEKSSDGIVILNVHSIEFSNNRMCEMSGYPMNEILGKNFLDLVAPEDMERLQASYQDGPVDGTKTENIEVNIISREKKKIPVETNAQIIVYKGRPATMVTIRDITKRKQAEEALKASEQNFRNSIDSSSLGIRISDIDNNTLYANQTLLDIFGYKDIDEVRAKSPQEYYSPESYADYLKMMDKYGRGEIIPDQVDIDIVRKDGTVRHLLTVFKEVFWDGKQQYQTLYNDITENKEIEIALRESEEKYRTIFESANDILMLLDTSGKILDVNKRLTEIGGYDRYELIDKNITELTHIIDEKNMAIVVGNLWKMVNSGEAVTYQVEMIKKNQEPIFIEINAVPIQKWGKVVGVLAILRDITERNKSELRIRESEEKYRTIFESANDILMLLDTNGKILDVNGRLTEIGGYDRYELIDKNFLELTHIIDKKNMAIVLANLQKIVAGSSIVTYQVEMIKKNREPIFMEINAVPVLKEGKIIGVLGILRDITERNRSELQIRESEEKYRTIFESANDIIMLLDTKGKILDVNGRLTDIGGYEKDELIGKNVSELAKIISLKSLPVVVTNLLKRMAGLEVSTYQVEMVKKNRELVNVEINAVPIRKDGKIIGDLAILRDITERRKSELQIREQKALTDRILKSTPNVVAVVGRDQRIIMVNKAFEQAFELGEGQAEGKNIGKFITVPHLVDTISQVLSSGETKSQIEFRIKRGAVVSIWVANIISMQQNEVLIVLRDITEEREMQERLYLTDRLASVGEMAAGIAHELNNPLTGVVALSQLLLESGVPDEMKDDIVAISKEGQRAAEVVRNLLSFARSHTLSISSTEINSVIKEVLSLRAYEHNVNNITVTTNLAPDLPEIMTDRFQMQQVFLNIILNAEHAMIEANRRGNLIITTEQNDSIIKISFTNDGPAIPRDIINRIFDPFFTTKDVGKGTGLGLSICYGIVTKQGGKIYAQSQEGKGATFIIELPLKSY